MATVNPPCASLSPALRPRHQGRCVGWFATKRMFFFVDPRGQRLVYQGSYRSQEKMKISGAQITAARNLLRITQAELAQASGVAEGTVKSFEADHRVPLRSTLDKIVTELERRGIEFTNGDGAGVRINYAKAAEYARTAGQGRKPADQ